MARYWKQDCELGFIEDTAQIQYQKFNNLRHSIIGFMLGDYDEEGNYIISPEIKKELISMTKYIVESLDNIEICQSELRLNKNLSFMVTFEGNKATLSLLEKVYYEANFKLNSGSYSNINEYVLDEVETSGAINRNVIYQRWNIKEFGGNQIDIFNCDEELLAKYFGIVNRFKYLLAANTVLLEKEEELEEIESAYTNKLFEILKRYPELNKVVVEKLQETLNEKKEFVCIDQPFFAKTINEILDKAIENNLSVLNEEEQTAFKSEHRNLLVETNIKRENAVEVVEKKTEEKNKEEENSVKIFILKTKEETKSVQDLASEFAHTKKTVEEKRREQEVSRATEKKDNKEEKEETKEEKKEREKLIAALTKDVKVKPENIQSKTAKEKIGKIEQERSKEQDKKVEASAETNKGLVAAAASGAKAPAKKDNGKAAKPWNATPVKGYQYTVPKDTPSKKAGGNKTVNKPKAEEKKKEEKKKGFESKYAPIPKGNNVEESGTSIPSINEREEKIKAMTALMNKKQVRTYEKSFNEPKTVAAQTNGTKTTSELEVVNIVETEVTIIN